MNKTNRSHRILILDGQGGGMGAQLIRKLLPLLPQNSELLCVGTNVMATSAMLKAGCPKGATGENAMIYQAAHADVILGPIGIILAHGMLGEVSPNMAAAVSGSSAIKILIPVSTCGVRIAGNEDCPMEEYLRRAVGLIQNELSWSEIRGQDVPPCC